MTAPVIEYPIRINRYLLLKGICSRREADRLIERKNVRVNGRVAVLGDQVHEHDQVTITKHEHERLARRLYIIYHKPRGIVSHNPQQGEQGIDDVLKTPTPVYPLGRLDKQSRGLMLLSNDGRIVDRLLNPTYEHEKEYVVQVDKPLTERFLRRMTTGVDIEGYTTKPTRARQIGPQTFRLILTEGKKHQIRRMCAALGFQVRELKRIRIMHIKLGKLKEGAWRDLTKDELARLLCTLGVEKSKTRVKSRRT